MRIAEAARAAGLPVKTVRYYADIGLAGVLARNASGYRLFDEASVQRLIFIRRAREFGFSIAQCRELLGLYEDDGRASADVKKIAAARLAEIERKQRELQYLHNALARLVAACKGDQRPDCPIVTAFAGDAV